MIDRLLCHIPYLQLKSSGYILQTPTHNILIDLSHSTIGTDLLYDYLVKLNIEKIDLLIITHPHYDHFGGQTAGSGFGNILSNFEVGEVWYNGWPIPLWYDGLTDSPSTQYMTRSLLGMEYWLDILFPTGWSSSLNPADHPTITGTPIVPYREPIRGEDYVFGDLTFKILHPVRPFSALGMEGYPITSTDENNASIVIQAVYKGKKLMLTGDLSSGTYGEISVMGAYTNAELKSDFLYLGHHGMDGATSASWLNAVDPTIATVQSRTESFSSERIMNELSNRDISLYDPSNTNVQEGYVFVFNENIIQAMTESEFFAPHPNNLSSFYIKHNGEWINRNDVYEKHNGVWQLMGITQS